MHQSCWRKLAQVRPRWRHACHDPFSELRSCEALKMKKAPPVPGSAKSRLTSGAFERRSVRKTRVEGRPNVVARPELRVSDWLRECEACHLEQAAVCMTEHPRTCHLAGSIACRFRASHVLFGDFAQTQVRRPPAKADTWFACCLSWLKGIYAPFRAPL